MPTQHELTCPVCHSTLLLEHSDSVGGVVQSNLTLIDAAKETPVAAKARAARDAAQAKFDEAAAAEVKAQGALDAAAAAIPTNDGAIKSASEALASAKAEREKAQAALDVAESDYARARALPPPPPIGTLSPDGNWKWDGSKWVEVAKTPPPLPASLGYEDTAETPAQEQAEEPINA